MPIYTFAVLFLTTSDFELRNKNLKTRKETNRELMQYAGMGAQFLVSIALGIFIGLKLDEWLNFSFPLLVWLLPLFVITGLIIKIVKDTSKK
jgi:Mn2+/Fe2+ NRAMP family transporter